MKTESALATGSFPEYGNAPEKVYASINNELDLDGNCRLDLGSFTTTGMDCYADKLIMEQIGKNFIDHSEYGQTKKIHDAMVRDLAVLLHAPDAARYEGTATLGSSEAIHLALLAHKWLWKGRDKRTGATPNIVYTSNSHVCWDKFALYFDVEPRKVMAPIGEFPINELLANIDENTICVGAIAGNTYTGHVDPIAALDAAMVTLNRQTGWDIGIHVDAAIGGFVLPFSDAGKAGVWDFRLPSVKSINLSGHKFGLVYPGIGWLLFRDKKALPDALVFRSHYLGAPIATYSLNFSKSAALILTQYYAFQRHGKAGYRAMVDSCAATAAYIRERLQAFGSFEIVSTETLPVIVFRFGKQTDMDSSLFVLRMRSRNWMLPSYCIPGDASRDTYMRIVVKPSLDIRVAAMLCDDISDILLNNRL